MKERDDFIRSGGRFDMIKRFNISRLKHRSIAGFLLFFTVICGLICITITHTTTQSFTTYQKHCTTLFNTVLFEIRQNADLT
jgi:hypothetical protein